MSLRMSSRGQPWRWQMSRLVWRSSRTRTSSKVSSARKAGPQAGCGQGSAVVRWDLGDIAGHLRLKQGNQRRDVLLNGLPEYIQVDVEVRMHQTMAHAGHVLPRNVRHLITTSLRDLVGGFADDLDGLYQGQHQFAVTVQVDTSQAWVNSSASCAASSMCRKRTVSLFSILDLRFLEHLVTEIPAQVFTCTQVYLPPTEQR